MMRPIILIPLPFHFLIELPKRRGFLFRGGGGYEICEERGEFQTPIMILPPEGEIIELIPKGGEVVVMEDGEREEKSLEGENTYTSWEESCLLRFSKFLGMSPVGYENEVLALMHKINGRRLDERGKEVQRMTEFDREMKKL